MNNSKIKISILLLGLSTLGLAQETTTSVQKDSIGALKGKTFGEKLSHSSSGDSLESIHKALNTKSSSTTVALEGEVTQVCENRGCWIVIKTPKNEKFLVEMKDYGFFVPKGIEGKRVVLEGIAQEKEAKKQTDSKSKSKEIRIIASGIKVLD